MAARSRQTVTEMLAALIYSPSPWKRRVRTCFLLLFPVVCVLYALTVDAFAPLSTNFPPFVREIAFIVGGASLYLSGRWPVVPAITALVVWGITGSAVFVIGASYILARRQPRGWWIALTTIIVAHPLGLVPAPLIFREPEGVLPLEAVPVYAGILPALIGYAIAVSVKVSGLKESALSAAAEIARAEADRAVLEDRLRISREMHDILGQKLSLTVLDATALIAVTTDPRARDLARKIARTGRETADDLRYILGFLRTPEADRPALAGPPLEESVSRAQAAGLHVTTELGDGRALLSSRVAALVDSVAAEALHNIVKYAPGARVRVTLTVDTHATLVVSNGAAANEHPDPLSPGGYGLASLMERVADLNGQFTATRTADGGFMVTMKVSR